MPPGARRRALLRRYGAPVIGALAACVLLLVLWWLSGDEERPDNQPAASANDECSAPEPEANRPVETPPSDDVEPEPEPFVQPGEEVTLVRIADAGSVIVRADGETFRVMLAAIEAPEVGEPGYSSAVAALKKLAPAEASKVTIEGDPLLPDKDTYNKPIRYLWVDGVNVNVELVRQSHARYTGQSKYDAAFRQ